jgi:hypothetical protein
MGSFLSSFMSKKKGKAYSINEPYNAKKIISLVFLKHGNMGNQNGVTKSM